MKLFLIAFYFTGIFSISAQSYNIGHLTLNVTDSSRSNRNIPLEIYYPADSSGNNVPVKQDTVEYPVLAFGHGFVMTWDAYQNIWEALVPQGYVIAFPKTETGFSPNHLEFGKDLAFTISFLQQLNSDSASGFFHRLASTSAVMGHSMGGGASF